MNDELVELLNGLKPCPFCGRYSTILRREIVSKSGMYLYTVRCYRCGAEGPKVYRHGEYSREAMESAASFWNGRAEQND